LRHPKIQGLLEILDDMWLTDNWIDPMNPELDGWSNEQASQPYGGAYFSVQDQVNHVAFWEELCRRQLTGESLEGLGDLKAASWGHAPGWMPKWPETATYYRHVREGVRQALSEIDLDLLPTALKTGDISREALVTTTAIHGAYHAGQLSLLRRLMHLPEHEVKAENVSPKNPEPVEGVGQLLLDMMDNAWSSGYSIPSFEPFTRDWSKEKADWRPREGLPSSTDIVNHIKFWEAYACRRFRGEATKDMAKVGAGDAPKDAPGWPQAREGLVTQHNALRAALASLGDEHLARPCPRQGKPLEKGHTAQWLAQGIVVHHAYHVGQLTLMRQLAGDAV